MTSSPSDANAASCPQCGAPLDAGCAGLCRRCLAAAALRALDTIPAPAETVSRGTLGDYELIEEIARGGTAVVWKARQRGLKRMVALKIVRDTWLPGEEAARRFRQEAEMAARLRHPHIVVVHEVGEADAACYLSMELIEGASLAARLRERRFTPREAATLVVQAARAVQHAHERGVLHRDLKPGNILLDADGEPHVADFGLARLAGVASDLTHTGAAVGTPAYMPPEHADGRSREATIAGDVYGLGAILYELLAGQPPFAAATPVAVLRRIIEEQPQPLRKFAPTLDRDVETVCLKCLAKSPGQRYPSALALAEDLEHWLRGEPISARRVPLATRAVMWARRRPAIVALIALAVVLLVGGIVGITWQWQRAAGNARREAAARRAVDAKRIEALRILHAADMNLCQQALRANNLGRARALVDRCRPQPGQPDFRGWEWRYLWQQCRSSALATVHRFDGSIVSLSVAHDGRSFAIQGNTGPVELWDVEKGNRIATLGEGVSKGRLLFSPTESLLALTGNDGRVHLRTLPAGIDRAVLALDTPPRALAFSADGAWIATLEPKGRFSVWSTADGAKQCQLDLQASNVFVGGAIAFIPGATPRVAVGHGDGFVSIVRVPAGEIERTWNADTRENISAVAASPDGRWLATGAALDDPAIKVWQAASGALITTLAGHTSWTSRLTFTPGGTHLISSNADQTLRFWETEEWRETTVLRGHADEIWTHALSPDGRVLVTSAKDGAVLLWPATVVAQPRALFDFPEDTITECTTRDGRVVTLDLNKTCTVYERGTWQATRVTFPRKSIWLCDAAGVFSQLDSETIGFFDLAGGMAEPQAKWKIGRAKSVSVARRDVVFLTQQGRVIVSPIDQPGIQETLPPLPQPAIEVEVTDDGTELIVDLPNGDIYFWNLAARKFVRKVPPRTVPGRGRASPDASLMAWLQGFDAGLMPLYRPINLHTWHFDGTASALAWTRDGKVLAIGSYDATALVWDVASEREVTRLRGHLNAVHSAAFTPDSARLVTFCSNAEAAKFWDTTTWQELITLSGPPMITDARFSPTGDVIFIRSSRGRHAWWAPSFAEIDAAEKVRRW